MLEGNPESELVKHNSLNYESTIRKWQNCHEVELKEIKDLSYDTIYNRAVSLFKIGRIGTNLHRSSIKALGLDDTRSLYVMNYFYYLNGYTTGICTNNMKQAVRKEILHAINIELIDEYSVFKTTVFDVYENIPFTDRLFTISKLLIDGYNKQEIQLLLNMDNITLQNTIYEMGQFALDNDYCGKTQYLIDLISERYKVKFG